MRRLIFLSAFLVQFGCGEITRSPGFSVDVNDTETTEVDYNVTAYEIDHAAVARANRTPFHRIVTIGGAQRSKRVPETSLFSRYPSGTGNPKIRLIPGDVLTLKRSGFLSDESGVSSRRQISQDVIIDESGGIDLPEGPKVLIEGLTLSQASEAVENALISNGYGPSVTTSARPFPMVQKEPYFIGVGDTLSVSRLVASSNLDGSTNRDIEVTSNVVSASGTISLIEVGDVEVEGLSLRQAREALFQEAIRNIAGTDLSVEIENFRSRSVMVVGDLGTDVIFLDDQNLTYDRLLARLKPQLQGDRDYLLTLDRDGSRYQMTARTLLTDGQRDQIFVQDGDRLLIENHLPALDVSLTLKASAQRAVTYVRATGSGELSRSSAVSLPTQGMSLRDLLVSERLDIGKNRDLLVRLVRSDGHYRLSAQQILLGKENKNINLRAGDHVIVEDIAYVDDAALLVGELRAPSRMPIDRNSRTTLSEALFTGGIFGSEDADFRHVYVLRGEGVEYDAYHFDISEVLNLGLAEQFELRPRDIVFVGTRPISGYNRALALSLIFLGGLEQLRTVGQ